MKEKSVIDNLFDADGKPVKPWRRKQIDFITHYLANKNGKQAAIKAGYAKKSATVTAAEILAYPHVKEFLNKLAVETITGAIVKVDPNVVLNHHKAMAEADLDDFISTDERGRPYVDWAKAKKKGVTKAAKTLKITELPPMKMVVDGAEMEREVLKVEITLHDKPKTNADLMRHLGISEPAPAARPDPTAPAGVTNIQNNFIMGPQSELEIVKRIALLLSRGAMPSVTAAAGAGSAGPMEPPGGATAAPATGETPKP